MISMTDEKNTPYKDKVNIRRKKASMRVWTVLAVIFAVILLFIINDFTKSFNEVQYQDKIVEINNNPDKYVGVTVTLHGYALSLDNTVMVLAPVNAFWSSKGYNEIDMYSIDNKNEYANRYVEVTGILGRNNPEYQSLDITVTSIKIVKEPYILPPDWGAVALLILSIITIYLGICAYADYEEIIEISKDDSHKKETTPPSANSRNKEQ